MPKKWEWGTARCADYCAGCQKRFNKGDRVAYRPGERPAHAEKCGCGARQLKVAATAV